MSGLESGSKAPDALARLRYGPSVLRVALLGAFFVACGVVATLGAQATGRPQLWAASLGSWGLVAMAIAGGVRARVRPRWIIITAHGLSVTGRACSKRRRFIPQGAVTRVRERELAGQVLLEIGFIGGRITLARSQFPNRRSFDAVAHFAAGGRWHLPPRGEGTTEADASAPTVTGTTTGTGNSLDSQHEQTGDTQLDAPVALDETPPPMRAIRYRRAQRPPTWLRPAVHVASVLSFCGGPLWLTERLTPALGQFPAFVVTVAPLAVLAFVVLTIAEDAPGPYARVWAITGAVALGVVALETVGALLALPRGVEEPALLLIGTCVTVVATVLYARLAFPR